MGLIGIFGLFDIEPELYAAADILHTVLHAVEPLNGGDKGSPSPLLPAALTWPCPRGRRRSRFCLCPICDVLARIVDADLQISPMSSTKAFIILPSPISSTWTWR